MHTAHVLDVLNDDLDTANREIARLRQIVAGNARNTVEAVRTAVCSSRTQTEDALRLFDHRLEAFALKVAARASDGYASIQEQEATDLRLHFTRMLTLFAVRAQDPVTGGIDSTGLPEAAPIPSTKDTSEIEQINKQNAEHEHRVVILKDEWEKENCRQKEIVQKLKQEIDVLKNPKSPSPQSKHTAPSDTRNVQHASASQSSLEPTEKRIVAGVEYSRMRANHRHSQWWTSAPKISTLGGETFLEYAFHVDLNPDLGIVDESAFKVNPTTGLPAFHHVASGRKAGGWISTPELVPCTTSNSEYARRVQWAILTPIADFNI